MFKLLTSNVVKYMKENSISYSLDKSSDTINVYREGMSLKASMKDEGKDLYTYIYDSNNKKVDSYSININESKDNALYKSLNIYRALSESYKEESDNITSDDSEEVTDCDCNTNDDSEEILNEEGEDLSDPTDEPVSNANDIPSGLREVYANAMALGDKLRDLSTLSNDAEMVSVIMDLANGAYGLAVDIQDANQTYIDLLQDEADEGSDK